MFLLPVAALSVMAFFAVLILLTAARACEIRQRKHQPEEKMLSGLGAADSLDGNSRLVWATQLVALQHLESAGSQGIHMLVLRPWYAVMTRRFPALYEGHSYEEWLDFLQDSRVVYRSDQRLLLTARGHVLLDYCREACDHDFR